MQTNDKINILNTLTINITSTNESMSTVDATTLKSFTTVLVTFLTNAIILTIFFIVLFPVVYCYKRVKQLIANRRTTLSNTTPSAIVPRPFINTIAVSNQLISFNEPPVTMFTISHMSQFNEINNTNHKRLNSKQLPPNYENIDRRSISSDSLPSYNNYVKSKHSSCIRNN